MANPRDKIAADWARQTPSSYVEGGSSSPNLEPENFRHNDAYGGIPQRFSSSSIPTISESYTVLPVGHGNFLKVYHTTQHSSETDTPTFNNYELFSSNSFIPHHTARTPNVAPSDGAQAIPTNENTTNMIINQLVTNWAPSLWEQPIPARSFNNSSDESFKTPEASSANIIISDNGVQNIANTSPKTNGSFEKSSQNIPEVKKRIVAEVKPMRMSYSDVLSKNVSVNRKIVNGAQNSSYSSDSSNQNKSTKLTFEKNKNSFNGNEKKGQNIYDDRDKQDIRAKKSDFLNAQNKNEENTSMYANNSQKDKTRSVNEENGKDNNINLLNNKATKKTGQSSKKKPKGQPTSADISTSKKRQNNKSSEDGVFYRNNSKENEKEFYYNVTKNDSNFDKQQKLSQHSNPKKTKLANSSQKNSSYRSEKSSAYSKRNQKPRKNDKYEIIAKVAEKWLELMMKIFTWLFYLIYDIVVLGFGVVYDRINYSYVCLCSFFVTLKQEFRNNSGKPNAWIKNLFKKFDSKFSKGSIWAFWRRFYKKKPQEPETDFYKNGRLPQTGDEAMYSLLNCKGKDAYSILGVTVDSTQEQIRKHYKKIAVLVHPDKNKQPGAEEAFKVLQRAFELIGEPENRKTYDQSLAEALNAEKAWSELHDLLSQLQSKIAEAANTIRCSSCGLRHPRKLTERPHYAARECSSCKIKHSAREGDIWAETSMFGLRWKYLALMEGKVYDITEWANCQKGALSHLQPNSHIVQYRIVRGGQQQNQHQQQQQEKERSKKEAPSFCSEPSLDEFLDNLYSGQNPQTQQSTSRRRTKRN